MKSFERRYFDDCNAGKITSLQHVLVMLFNCGLSSILGTFLVDLSLNNLFSPSFVGNNRGRFQSGRGSGFRNEGGRGRGNYGGGRNYNRGDYNGRNEFSNRGGNRGGSSNRGGDGYQRSDSNGGRMSRTGASGMPNGTAKNMAPRVSATA